MVKLNEKGVACPGPVIDTKKAIEGLKSEDVIEVTVDNEAAFANVSRFAEHEGFTVKKEKISDNEFVITINVDKIGEVKASEEEITDMCGDCKKNVVVVISSKCMGEGDEVLGANLMKAYIYALTQLDTLPSTILFYNGGAYHTVEGSVSLDDLKSLEKAGVEILTCGTCLNHYGIQDKLAVGSVTNMYEIANRMANATVVVKP